MNLAKNHDFEEFSFQELVNSGQQTLTKVALVKNMMFQFSETVPDVILSFPEHFKIFWTFSYDVFTKVYFYLFLTLLYDV